MPEPMSPEIAHALRQHSIEVVETPKHYLLTRGECIALLERTADGIGSLGSTGMLTPNGLAFLMWQDGVAMLAAKGTLITATESQAEAIRAFSSDVKSALG